MPALLVLAFIICPRSVVQAQFSVEPELSLQVHLELAETAELNRADAFLAAQQWDEAVETLSRVLENDGPQLVPLDPQTSAPDAGYARFATVRELCQRRLAELQRTAPQALAVYRRRVDPLARQWYESAVAERDESLLGRIVQRMFASSFGDDALLRLGEFALERGEFTRARESWERISPLLRAPSRPSPLLSVAPGGPLWLAVKDLDLDKHWGEIEPLVTTSTVAPAWLAYPDTDLPLADVRMRLVLVSILEGSPERARVELDLFRRLHADAEGTIAGRTGKYVNLLQQVLDESGRWPPNASRDDWPTFAGAASRNREAAMGVDIAGTPLWSVDLPRLTADGEQIGLGRGRVSEDEEGLLSYHPVVVMGLESGPVVLWNDRHYIKAAKLHSSIPPVGGGQPAPEPGWPGAEESYAIFPTTKQDAALFGPNRRYIGVPRFTLTASGPKLFARMGSPITGSRDNERLPNNRSYLIGLDLSRGARRLPGFPIAPDGPRWEFDGSPLTDGAFLYVTMRQTAESSALAELYVACYELPTVEPAEPLRPRWRVKVCAADTPTFGQWDELTHNLLTLDEGVVYCNTNLGAVAALDQRDGAVRWLTRYPRAPYRSADPDRSDLHYFRDLNPCVRYKGLVLVAPTDCDRIFALDSTTGQRMWDVDIVDAVHLLGVGQDNLIAGGDSLYWIDVYSGTVTGQFPQPAGRTLPGFARADPPGYGRGILAGGRVYWPTREHLFVFEQRTQKEFGADGRSVGQPRGVAMIPLAVRGTTGGNLVIADGVLLIATADKLMAFDEFGPNRQ